MTTLASIFVKGYDMTIVVMQQEGNKTAILKVWDSSKEGAIAYILGIESECDYFVVNADQPQSETPYNVMKEVIESAGISKPVYIMKSFEPAVGVAVVRHATDEDRIRQVTNQWHEITSDSGTPPMAVFQGMLSGISREHF